jgi:hypothetical protein
MLVTRWYAFSLAMRRIVLSKRASIAACLDCLIESIPASTVHSSAIKATGALAAFSHSTSCVDAEDFDEPQPLAHHSDSFIDRLGIGARF